MKWKILNFLGVVPAPEKRLKVRFKFRFYVFSSLFMLVVGLYGASVYSTSPAFCKSCHIMEPYYRAWETSKHNEVACVECHYPPGEPKTILWKKFQALSQVAKYVTRTYSSKPFAEVEDSSCLRSGCHATRLLQGLVVTAGGVRFDHKPHLEGVRYGRHLRCVSCHSQIVVGNHMEVTWTSCFLCHLKGHRDARSIKPMGGCTGCHFLPDKTVKVGNIQYNHKEFLGKNDISCDSCHQDVIQGEGNVSKERCLACHNQPEKLARFNEDAFVHDNHVSKHNVACLHCHEEIKHGKSAAGTKRLAYDCATCHSDTHDLQKSLYTGTGAIGVEKMPSPMYLSNVDCVACHIEKKADKGETSKSETFGGSEKGCTACHGKEFNGILNDVHEVVRTTVSQLEANLKAVEATPNSKSLQHESALSEARHNLNFIKLAHSIHNIYYAASVLRKVDEQINSVAKKVEAEVENTRENPVISGGFCATLCHSKVGVKVPPEKVMHDGKQMPHMKHVEEGIACVSCHTFGNHKDVKLKTPTNCKRCHEN